MGTRYNTAPIFVWIMVGLNLLRSVLARVIHTQLCVCVCVCVCVWMYILCIKCVFNNVVIRS